MYFDFMITLVHDIKLAGPKHYDFEGNLILALENFIFLQNWI